MTKHPNFPRYYDFFNEKDYFFRIEREALNTIITNWSLDKLDRWHLQEDVMLLAEPVIMDGGE